MRNNDDSLFTNSISVYIKIEYESKDFFLIVVYFIV